MSKETVTADQKLYSENFRLWYAKWFGVGIIIVSPLALFVLWVVTK